MLQDYTRWPEHFWNRVDRGRADDCWLWTGPVNPTGYRRTTITIAYRTQRRDYAHRIAWELTHGAMPARAMCVLHACDQPPCCNPAHLFVGTRADNTHDAVAKHRLTWGSAHDRAKLSEQDVHQIRAAQGRIPSRVLAGRFGITPQQVGNIWHGRNWNHLPWEDAPHVDL